MQPMAAVRCSDITQDYYGVREKSAGQLQRLKRELSIAMGMAAPRSLSRSATESYLSAVQAELEDRRWFETAYLARENQVSKARHAVAEFLSRADCPSTDNAELIISELTTNSVRHSLSRHGGQFTVRAELLQGFTWIEVEDAGGPVEPRIADGGDLRPDGRGLILVKGLCGPGNWGADSVPGGRVVWARL